MGPLTVAAMFFHNSSVSTLSHRPLQPRPRFAFRGSPMPSGAPAQYKDGSWNLSFYLVARHLQRFWGASGDFWQDLWTKLYVAYEGHDQALFYLGKVVLFTLSWVRVLGLWNGSLFHNVRTSSCSAATITQSITSIKSSRIYFMVL